MSRTERLHLHVCEITSSELKGDYNLGCPIGYQFVGKDIFSRNDPIKSGHFTNSFFNVLNYVGQSEKLSPRLFVVYVDNLPKTL